MAAIATVSRETQAAVELKLNLARNYLAVGRKQSAKNLLEELLLNLSDLTNKVDADAASNDGKTSNTDNDSLLAEVRLLLQQAG
jgi:hypothetical protein